MSNLLYNIKLIVILLLYRVQVGLIRAFPSILDKKVRLERVELKNKLRAEKRERALELREKKRIRALELREKRIKKRMEMLDGFKAYIVNKLEVIKSGVKNLLDGLDQCINVLDNFLSELFASIAQYLISLIRAVSTLDMEILVFKKFKIRVNKRTIALIAPILISSLFVLSLIHNSYLSYSKSLKAQQDLVALVDYEAEIWKRSYKEAEVKRVGIIFDEPEMTDEDYEVLRAACLDYVNSMDLDISTIDKRVASAVISERQYIDGKDLNITNNNYNIDLIDSADMFVESNVIYFQDALLAQYVSQDGIMRDIVAMYNPDKSDILFLSKEDLHGSKFGDSEGVYLDGLKESIRAMFKARSLNELYKAEGLVANYFTNDSKSIIFGAISDSGVIVNESSEIEPLFCIAGRSSLSKGYKDRVYMKLRMYAGDAYYDTYIILKLNSNLKVFDVDII